MGAADGVGFDRPIPDRARSRLERVLHHCHVLEIRVFLVAMMLDKAASFNTKVGELIRLVQPYEFVVVITRDTPDADSIAAGWAIKHLLDEESPCETRFIAGGEILRSENRRMVELLRPPLEILDEYFVVDNIALIFVDCGPDDHPHLLDSQLFDPLAVINHHEIRPTDCEPKTERRHLLPPLVDIQTEVAATSTIVTSYLMGLESEPSDALATALLYGIRSESQGCQPTYTDLDRRALEWLVSRANLGLLADIENAPLTKEYFSDFVQALQSCKIFGDSAFCMLPRAECAETIGEVADLLIRHQDLKRVLCAAVYKNRVVLSARTAIGGGNAAALLSATVNGVGRAAGHKYRASGTLAKQTLESAIDHSWQSELQGRWLAACQINDDSSFPLLTST